MSRLYVMPGTDPRREVFIVKPQLAHQRLVPRRRSLTPGERYRVTLLTIGLTLIAAAALAAWWWRDAGPGSVVLPPESRSGSDGQLRAHVAPVSAPEDLR